MPIWGLLLNFIGGPIITGIIDGYKAKLSAENTTEHEAADLAKKEIEAEIEARKQANITMALENGRWFTWMPRAIVCWSFAIFTGKCVVYDKVLGWGSTDPLSGDIASWAGMVMAVWFGGRTIEKVAQIFKRQ